MYYFIKINKLIEKLEKKDIFSLSDFFVEIKYNDQIRITTTKWNNQIPVWNEIFLFEERGKEIEIILMEDNKWTSNTEIHRETLEIQDDGTLKNDNCAYLEIEHGYVSVKSAKKQMSIMENLGIISESIGNGFSSLKNELKSLKL